jgi:glutamine synthetase
MLIDKKEIKKVLDFAKDNKVEMVDFKFCGLFGRWHHLTLPATRLSESLFETGESFDASSIPGFKTVESGDMALIPDPTTALIDPFWEKPTLSFICNIEEVGSGKPFVRDPRVIANKAEEYLIGTGIADKSCWGPEFEYYIFDHVAYRNDINMSSYVIDSEEADWNSGLHETTNLGHKIPRQGGYHAIPPLDATFNLRTEMVRHIEDAGIPVRYHHHEVGGPGQSEIEIALDSLTKIGDMTMLIKYIIKMTANKHQKTVTFMPKPLFNEAGSGMHVHQHLFKKGKPVFYDKNGYGYLSKDALYYIGGLLHHGPALLAFTNPSTNSYKRLVPGFEAPVTAIFGLANRSAAIRIPKLGNDPMAVRIEFRPPDGTCNIYLALVAMLMAGLDGIKNKIDPKEMGFGPIDVNIFNLSPKEKAKLKKLPASLKEAMDALEKDHSFLLEGGVFDEATIQTWIDYKIDKEFNAVRNRPHPYEMSLYYDV